MRPKTVLVLSGGAYAIQVICQIQALGYRAVVIDRDPRAPAFEKADAYEAVNIVDRQAVLRVAREHHVDGIMPVSDFGVRSYAYATQALGLVGIDPVTAERCLDKGLMRECWQNAGLAIPDFRVVTSLDEAQQAAGELGYPLVMKPTDSGGGGRGVSIIRDMSEVSWAYEFARPFARNGRLILEGFLDGIEMTVESMSYAGRVVILAMSDKEKPPLRTRVATSLNYPAAFPETTLAQVRELVTNAVLALGITNGPGHTELIVTPDGPKLVEAGARPGGGHIFSLIVHAVSGVNMVHETAKLLVGKVPNLEIRYQRGCVYRFLCPPSGVVKAIHGVEEARALPGVLDIGILKKPGDRVQGLINSLERSGFAVVAGKDRSQAIERANRVERTVVFEMASENG